MKAAPMEHQETVPMHVDTQLLTGVLFEAECKEASAASVSGFLDLSPQEEAGKLVQIFFASLG